MKATKIPINLTSIIISGSFLPTQPLPLDATYFLRRTANIKEVLADIKKLRGLITLIANGS
jgi:hypothetical protein